MKTIWYLLLIFVSCGYALYFLNADMHNLVGGGRPDDAGYYMQIAANAVSGYGFTFDKINPTNGFHPLWMLLLLPLMYLFQQHPPESLFRLALVLQVLLLTGAGAILWRVLRRWYSDTVALIGGMLYLLFVFFRAANGLETTPAVCMLIILLYYGQKLFSAKGNAANSDIFLLGLLCGLLMLARLDTVFIAGMVLFSTLLAYRIRCSFAAAGFLLVVGPYLVFNYCSFSHIVPVSGTIKSTFPHFVGAEGFQAQVQLLRRQFAFAAVVFAYLFWWLLFDRRFNTYMRTCLLIASCGAIVHFCYTMLFQDLVQGWYFMPMVLIAGIIGAELAASLLRRKSTALLYIIGLCIVCFVVGRHIYRETILMGSHQWQAAQYDIACWLRDNTDRNAIFGYKDAGYLGFFSGRRVVNLDGLANNFDYQEVLKNKKLKSYFNKKGLNYIIYRDTSLFNTEYRRHAIRYKSYRYNTWSDEITLRRSDEIYRDPENGIGIWRFNRGDS